MPLPQFLHIGAPKAASGWLWRVCQEHPEIYVPTKPDNVNFFTVAYHKGMEWYQEKYFSNYAGEKVAGEFSNSYYCFEPALQRIKKHLPNVKLTLTLREPVERAYLQWAHMHLKKKDSLGGKNKYGFDPDQGIGIPLARSLDCHGHGWFRFYMEPGMYAQHLRRIYRYFDGEQVLVMLHDDLVADDWAFVRRFFSFLGVDPDFKPSLMGMDINADVKQDKYRPTPEVLEELHASMREDIGELEEMLKRDLSHWKRPALAQV